MKQFFFSAAMLFSCAINAQMYTTISAEQPLLGYSDTAQTVVSIEISDYYRRGAVFVPFEGRIAQRGTNISFAKIGLGLGTLNDAENFRFGGSMFIEPIAFKQKQTEIGKEWAYNATISVDAFISYDFINDGTHRFGMKAGAEVRYETVNINPGFQISLKAGFYYALGHEAIMPAQIGCPQF